MHRTRKKRVWTGLLALATSATVLPLLTAAPASADGIPGTSAINPTSGDSSTAFTLNLPTGAACTQDSSNGGFNVTSYMVPASVNPATLQFDPITGPNPNGLGAGFRQPLYEVGSGSAFTGRQTADASTPGGPGPVINIPTFDLSSAGFAPGDIPAGAYNVGIACILGPADADQLHQFWNTTITVSTNPSGGPAQISWSQGAVPTAPTLTGLTPGPGSLAAAFTPVASTPATTGFTVTATPAGGGTAVTATGAGSPITVTGLTNGVAYDVTVRATNSAGNSAESNTLPGTPAAAPLPAVTNLEAVPGAAGSGSVLLTWDAPAGQTPTGYTVAVSPDEGSVSVSGTSATVSGLTAGTLYTFTVTPTHPAPDVALSASDTASPLAAAVLMQEIEVTRPDGVLVLTQVCGTNGAIPADTSGSPGFPAGSLPAIPADGSGTAPTLTAGGTDADPELPEYPLPDSPSYPTHCGVDLGTAELVKSGAGAGQFFATSGVLNQVTVVDTRDTDPGWTINGTMGTFSAGTGLEFSGSQLGWSPVASDTGPFEDSNGVDYDQLATAGPVVAPNSLEADGLSTGKALASADAGEGLGIARLDARLKLLIPVFASAGTYVGTLTISAL